ncbi:hypothetical protein T09_2802 [Trichinella sp. T9]|nr:hypothetical protein T09_2802 [Trichinella sp. T9]
MWYLTLMCLVLLPNRSDSTRHHRSQVWLCNTENAIGNGENVSGLKNTVKLQLGKTVGDALAYMTEKLCATFTARRGDTATQRPWQSLQNINNRRLRHQKEVRLPSPGRDIDKEPHEAKSRTTPRSVICEIATEYGHCSFASVESALRLVVLNWADVGRGF